MAALVTAYVDGADLRERFVVFDRQTQCALVRSLGRFLAELHDAFEFDEYGEVVVADGAVAAVLDRESPLAAAPALSVAKAEYLVADWYVADPDPLRTAFATGYEAVRPLPPVEPVHRAAAVCRTAVDSTGTVTNPGYPEFDREAAVAFHRRALKRALVDAASGD